MYLCLVSVCSYLVGQTCWLADDPERQRLFVTESLEVAGDPRPLDLPLAQVVGEPNAPQDKPQPTHSMINIMYVRVCACVRASVCERTCV